MEFSPIIKIAAISLTFSLVLIVATLIKILVSSLHNRKWNKTFSNMDKQYGDAVRYVLSPEASPNMTRQQVIDALDLDNPDNKDLLKNQREKLTFARLVYQSRISDEASLGRRKNLHILLNIFGIHAFLEDMVIKGRMKRKAEALTMLRAFKLPVNQWVANHMRNSKRYRLRRLSQYASIMSSSNTDMEYFESEFFDQNCCIYDEIQLGYVLQRRLAMKRKLPNLAQMALGHTNPHTQAVFVRLMRQFEQKEGCADLEELFRATSDKELIQEISRTWGYLGYAEGEDMLNEVILIQPDDTKVAIMHALTRINTGRSLPVLVDGYRNSGDQHVKFEALRCIFSYGEIGKAKFKELFTTAREDEKKFFDFFMNPLTRKEIRLSEDDTYDQQGEDNLFSVV